VIVHGRPIAARHEGGQRFALHIRGHELVVDQPPSAGGADAGPSSTELFVASLVGCIAHYGRQIVAEIEASTSFLKSPSRAVPMDHQ